MTRDEFTKKYPRLTRYLARYNDLALIFSEKPTEQELARKVWDMLDQSQGRTARGAEEFYRWSRDRWVRTSPADVLDVPFHEWVLDGVEREVSLPDEFGESGNVLLTLAVYSEFFDRNVAC